MILPHSFGAASPKLTFNRATWNPADKASSVTLSNGDLLYTSAGNEGVRSTVSVTTGKWYWEHRCGSITGIGVVTVNTPLGALYTTEAILYFSTNAIYRNGAFYAQPGAIATNDVVGIALDVDARTVQFYKNNTLLGTYPVAATGALFAGGSYNNTGVTNFGATAFTYAPPAGYNAGLYVYTAPELAGISRAVWNPDDRYADVTLSNVNLSASAPSAGGVRSTVSVSTGKWYWEVRVVATSGGGMVGVANALAPTNTMHNTYNGLYYYISGDVYTNGTAAYTFVGYAVNDILGFALDADAKTMGIYKNNTLVGTVSLSAMPGPYFASLSHYITGTANFGATTLVYAPPAGYTPGLYEIVAPVDNSRARWSATDKSAVVTLSGGNLTAAISSTGMVKSTISKATDNWYWEVKVNTVGGCVIGIATSAAALTAPPGSVAGSIGIRANGQLWIDGVQSLTFAALTANCIVGVSHNAGGMRFSVNGADQGGFGKPNGDYFAAVGSNGSATNVTANFGATALTYAHSGYNDGLYL